MRLAVRAPVLGTQSKWRVRLCLSGTGYGSVTHLRTLNASLSNNVTVFAAELCGTSSNIVWPH